MVPHREFFAVHKCTEEHEFEKARLGYQVLYYSSRPIPKGIVSKSAFPGEYYVPAEKAMGLLDLIKRNASSDEIVKTLGPERVSIDVLTLELDRKDRTQHYTPSTRIEVQIGHNSGVTDSISEIRIPSRPEFETQYLHHGGQLKNRRFYDEKD